MGMEALLGMLGGAGSTPSPNLPLDPTGPTLNELTLNPQVMGGQPPQVPYSFGQGPNLMRTGPTPPFAPGAGGPLEQGAPGAEGDGGKTWTDHINDFGKAMSAIGKAGASMKGSSIAQKMFQETQQKTMAQNNIIKGKMEEFKRKDLSSQILESYGLL